MLDKFRETAITWDKANRKVYEPLRVSAGDNKGRKLSVQVVNGGVVENITGSSLSLFWETRDKAHRGLDVFTTVDATKGEFEIYYTTGMLSNEGVLNANLVLVDTSGRVVSEPFTITVFKGIDDDAIQSSDSFTALTEALIDVSNLEQNYTPRLNDLTAQLQQTEQELNAQLAEKVYKVATVSDMLAHPAVNGDIFEIGNGKTYTITNDPKLVDDGNYVKVLSNGLKAVDHKLNEDFKQTGLRGIAITVTSNVDNYHLTQVNAQIPLAVELGTHVQLAVGVNFGDSTNSSGNIALSVTTAQLQACIDLIVNAGLVIDMIKLHSQGVSGDWAGYDIIPVSTSNFFTKYKSVLQDVATLCATNNIPILSMCNEQITTVSNTYYSQWSDITATLKTAHPSLKLTISFFPSTMVTCLTEYKLKYTNSVFQLLDYVSLNVYPAVLRKNEKYPYDYNAYDNGLNKPIDDTYIYKHMSVLELIDEIKQIKPVLITETGCIMYDTNTLINYFYAINNPLYRTGTEGKDQKEYYEEVLPALMNLTSGVYIWSSAAPFTPKNEGLVYLNNKLRTVI